MLCVWCLWSSSCLEGYHSFYAQLLRLGLSLGNFKVNDFLKGNVEYDKTYIKSAGSNIGQCSLWDTEEVTDLQKGWAWKKSIKNYAHSLMLFPDFSAYVNNIPRKILSSTSYCKEAYFIILWQIINVCFCLHFQRLSIETSGVLAINWLLLFILPLASLAWTEGKQGY